MDKVDATLLVVDDERYNLDILTHILKREGYTILQAGDGKEALHLLEEHDSIECVVLDRMMPVMDGMAMLQRMKADPRFQHIPVVMQTAAVEKHQILEGIRAGVYYYLTKPYSKRLLLAIIRAALQDKRSVDQLFLQSDRLARRAQRFRLGLRHMESSAFSFRTVDEAKMISSIVASCFPDPRKVLLGFTELMVNAVEHGNLEIPFEEKSRALIDGTWDGFLEDRLQHERYADRKARIELVRQADEVVVRIRDEGEGFNWREYLEMSPDRATSPNGRGLFMATMEFDKLYFEGNGNTVVCHKRLTI